MSGTNSGNAAAARVRRQQAIFADLVALEDEKLKEAHDKALPTLGIVRAIRLDFLDRYGISLEQLEAIIGRGIDRQWPPLDAYVPPSGFMLNGHVQNGAVK